MLIAGNFREYPFPLLLEIFLHRRETGLLEVSSTQESGYFYIKNGKVKDGQIGKSKGLAAVKRVGKINDGSFRFKPLEPTDYARIVWQRSFGPTGPSIGQPAISGLSIADKLGPLRFNPEVVSRVLNDVSSSAQRAFRQFVLYTSTAYHGLERIELFLRRRTVACVAAGVEFWRRARVGTKLERILMWALTALLQDKRHRERRRKYRYPRQVSFQVPTTPKGTAITSALQQGVEHNIIFVLTMTLLLGVSGLLLYELMLVNQESVDTGITVDQHFHTPADVTRTTKPKRPHKKRRSIDKPLSISREIKR